MIAVALLLASRIIASSPDLGKAQGQCRPHEAGPAFVVSVLGLKDRRGLLKLELYPANDDDFLADDNVLLEAGKTFRRVEIAVPPGGPVLICIRAPSPGPFALTLLHDRDSDRKFGLSVDGIGFGGNARIRLSRPSAAAATVVAGDHPTRTTIVLNYRRGLLSFGPLGG